MIVFLLILQMASTWDGFNPFGGGNCYTHAFGLTASSSEKQVGCTQLGHQEWIEFSGPGTKGSVCLVTPYWMAQRQVVDNDTAGILHLFPCPGCSINGAAVNVQFGTGIPKTALGIIGRVECISVSLTAWNCK